MSGLASLQSSLRGLTRQSIMKRANGFLRWMRGSSPRMTMLVVIALALAACGSANNGRLQGWVEGDFVFVGPDDAGRVETLNVREGNTVAAGAPLFAIDADLQAADVHTASAQVAEARARLARLESAQQRKEGGAVLQR